MIYIYIQDRQRIHTDTLYNTGFVGHSWTRIRIYTALKKELAHSFSY